MVQYKKSLAFGVWRLAFGVWRLAFGVWCLVELSSHVFFLHGRMIISFPKYHFYILYFTFNILHFFLRHKDTKAQRNTKAFSFPK